MTADILKNRREGHRDSTYAMLMRLVATNQLPECLDALEQVVRIGCWRDVRGFIRHFESHGCALAHAEALVAGCVRMTNAQIRKDHAARHPSWAAKWVPREPKCRGSPLMKWYYDALAADMFPGAPDANRRYRKLISALSPVPPTHPASPTLAWFVRQAERAQTDAGVQEANALWRQHLARCKPCHHAQLVPVPVPVPVLSLAHSMGPGHNNCLHAGIGLALHLQHLLGAQRLLTFSSHAEWHVLGNDFVSQVRQLLLAARAPTNGLNANAAAAASAAASANDATAAAAQKTLLIISDMQHDEPTVDNRIMTWNVSRNGLPASFCGDNPCILLTSQPHSQPHCVK